jgi:Zn-dependent protease/predicted transcriptional regulator
MKGSLRVARILGIDIYVHVTFWLLVGWIVLSDVLAGSGYRAALDGILMMCILFVIVVLHELGHAMAARRFGIRTERITLLPIGGVASMERIPDDPVQELVVAIAGPAVNIALAIIVLAPLLIQSRLSDLGDFGKLLPALFWINVFLAVFNMLPAFPMDGGRVLRAFLSLHLDRVRATQIAAALGKAFAVLFAIVGLFVNPFLILIGLFVWLGASAEAEDVTTNAALKGVRARHVMARGFQTMRIDETLADVARCAAVGFQTCFPVIDENRVAGVIDDRSLALEIAKKGAEAPLRRVDLGSTMIAGPEEMLLDILTDWQASQALCVVVIEAGNLVGLLTPETLRVHLAIHSSLSRTQPLPV